MVRSKGLLTSIFICAMWAVLMLIPDVAICSTDVAGAHHGVDIGRVLPVWTVIPFAGILLSIALCPLLVPHFWHNHFGKVSALWAVLFAVPFVYVYHGTAVHEILHIYLIDYIPVSYTHLRAHET